MKRPTPKCFLCGKVRAKHWVRAADYFDSEALTIEVRGLSVGLCKKCWFRNGVFDMSFYDDIARKLCEIFGRNIPRNIGEGPEEEEGAADGQTRNTPSV